MGNSVNAVGYRLSYRKNWKPNSSPTVENSFPSFYRTFLLSSLLERFFSPPVAPVFLYSHFSFCYGWGGLRIGLFLCSVPYQLLLKFLARKSRFSSSFCLFSKEFFSSSPVLDRSVVRSLNDFYLLFLRFRSFHSIASLLRCRFVPLFPLADEPLLPFHLAYAPTAPLLSRLLSLKLRSGRHRLARLLSSYAHYNFASYTKLGILGIRLEGAGRFTRTQKASFLFSTRGTVPLGTVSTAIDYFSSTVYLKYGACNLRVWLHFLKNF